MDVLDAFTCTWSNARSSFGQGIPQTGERFDASGPLQRLWADVGTAATGSGWSGPASAAYHIVNTRHGRVIGELAGLDQRLRFHVDQSAHLISGGRIELEGVRTWVLDAAAGVPTTTAGERMLLPIVQKGVGDVIDIVRRTHAELNTVGAALGGLGDVYRALGDQRFGRNGPRHAGGGSDDDGEKSDEYETALRDAGLLTGPLPEGYYKEWLDNARDRGVRAEVVVAIARERGITPASFDVLNGTEKVTDGDGKSFFLMPPGTSGVDARKAALLTYVLNAGTDYGKNPQTDFAEAPYSSDEVQRIIDRQNANSWSYDRDVDFVHENGGRLMTTPNGMLMGLGGSELQDLFSQGGGSTFGDIFMLNIDDPADPARQLRDIVESGVMWYPGADGNGYEGANQLDLDRVLHHEERHSQQWQRLGYLGFIDAYATGKLVEIFTVHPLEKDAGLSDGGYE